MKRYLIVVPVPGVFENIACSEISINLAQSGNEVYFLDLSCFKIPSFSKKIWWSIVRLTHRNLFPKIHEIAAQHFGFKKVETPKIKTGAKFKSQESAIETIFRRAFSSTHNDAISKKTFWDIFLSKRLLKLERKRFYLTHFMVDQLIKKHEIDVLITWNGRFIIDAAAASAASDNMIEVNFLEVVSGLRFEYEIFRISPHSLRNREELQLAHWNEGDDLKVTDALKGLNQKFKALSPQGNFSFRDAFSKPFVRDRGSKKLLTFFTTTEVENVAFADIDTNMAYQGRQDFAFREMYSVATKYGFGVIVRAHPRIHIPKSIADAEDQFWQEICHTLNIEYIPSDSPIDSYSLLQLSNLNVTYNSSIGIESIALGKPTLILGQTDYSYLVPELCAYTSTEINSFFSENSGMTEKSKLYPWAYWYISGGRKVKYFHRELDGSLKFLQHNVFEDRFLYGFIKKILRK